MRPKINPRRKRTVHVAIATMMLTVPASALALSGTGYRYPASAGTPLQARVTPREVRLNKAVTVTGTAPASDAGQRAVLRVRAAQPGRVAGGWPDARSRRAVTSGSGPPARSGYLRAIDAAPSTVASRSTPNRASRRPAARPARHSASRSRLSSALRITALDVLAGQPVTVSGAAASRARGAQGPPPGPLRQRLADARHATAPAAAGGSPALRRATSGRQRRLRVLFAGDRANARSTPCGRPDDRLPARASRPGTRTAATPPAAFTPTTASPTARCPCGTKVRSATADARSPRRSTTAARTSAVATGTSTRTPPARSASAASARSGRASSVSQLPGAEPPAASVRVGP